MEVVFTILLGALGLVLYLFNVNNNQMWRLKNELRTKEEEIRNLIDSMEESSRKNTKLTMQLQESKKNFLKSPNMNNNEILKLNKELTAKSKEFSALQKQFREKENELLRLKHSSENEILNLKKINADLQRKISELEQQRQAQKNTFSNLWSETGNENFSLKKQLEEKESIISNLQRKISNLEFENYQLQDEILKVEKKINATDSLKKTITNLKSQNERLKKKISKPKTKTKAKTKDIILPFSDGRFVEVVFKGYANRNTYDYLLGNNFDVNVGDFVMVPVKGGTIIPAKVVRISEPGERSKEAKSEIIEKIYHW